MTITFPVIFTNTKYYVAIDVSVYNANNDIAMCGNSYDKATDKMNIRFQNRGNTGQGINPDNFSWITAGY